MRECSVGEPGRDMCNEPDLPAILLDVSVVQTDAVRAASSKTNRATPSGPSTTANPEALLATDARTLPSMLRPEVRRSLK